MRPDYNSGGVFSYYRVFSETQPAAAATIEQVARMVRTDEKLTRYTLAVRAAEAERREAEQRREEFTDDERTKFWSECIEAADRKKKAAKKRLPLATFSGTFRKRGNKEAERISGYFCIDIDHIAETGRDIEETKHQLAEDEELCPVLLFVSPSGDGLKIVCKYDTSGIYDKPNTYTDEAGKCVWNDEHYRVFYAFQRYVKHKHNLEIDEQTKDLAHSCWLCHDGEALTPSFPYPFNWKGWEPVGGGIKRTIQRYEASTSPGSAGADGGGLRFKLRDWEAGRMNGGHTMCPNCGRLSLVPYYDTETGENLGESVGRAAGKCEHLNHCGYEYKPREFFRDYPEEAKRILGEANQDFKIPRYQDTKKRGTAFAKSWIPENLCTIPEEEKQQTLNRPSLFLSWLRCVLGEERANRVADLYQIGAMEDGRVIFWQTDAKGRTRDGKVLLYESDGHRSKYPDGSSKGATWYSSTRQKGNLLTKEWKRSQCLFGEHLLKDRAGRSVCIVESEKTALICAALIPSKVWLSCGGVAFLKPYICEGLRGIDCTVYPDGGAAETWRKMALECSSTLGGRWRVDNAADRMGEPWQREAGWDIADFLLMDLEEKRNQEIKIPSNQETKI